MPTSQRRIVFVLAITLFAGDPGAYAQTANRDSLDPAIIKVVDPLYPGFTEILERDDHDGLVKLARILSARPSPESLAVLLWMVRCCPSWPSDGVLQIDKTVRAVGTLPVAPVADALLNAAADQRLTAAGLLASYGWLISDSEKPLLDQTLIAALSDRDDRVRNMVAAVLRTRDSAGARAAVREDMARRSATVPKPPQPLLEATRFPPATTTLLESLDPDYHQTLTMLNEAAVRRLLAALQRSRNSAGTAVLVWLLANGDSRAYGGNVVYQLSLPEHATRLPFGELSRILSRVQPERKALIAELLANVLSVRRLTISNADRGQIVAALIECLDVAHDRLRTQAVTALGRARAAQAVRPIVRLLDQPEGDRYQLTTIHALATIGRPEAMPALERLARSGKSPAVREAAASAYITVTKPADPAAHLRRLLWEQPDAPLEKQVLAEGTRALPKVWQALAEGSADDRRTAAALLGWFRDVRSVAPIVAALDAAPGALTREQLLFDLNMILLTEAPPARDADARTLATLHLQWLYDELTNQHLDGDIRATVLAQKTIHVHPGRIAAPFSVNLGGARTVVSASPEAFLDAVRNTGCGLAFHAVTAANGVARVATTLYLPKGRIANQVWISLYRHDGTRWTPLPVPSHPVLHRLLNEPNLMPTIDRNYGPDHPLKILRLDLTMERIRVDLNAREQLHHENRETGVGHGALDASYVRLLERYKRSDSPAVRYTAEFESAQLTRQPNLDLWVAALREQAGSPIQELARRILADHVPARFRTDGRRPDETERSRLAAAALKPDAVDPRLLPTQPARPENIRNVRQWSRFGLIDVGFGSGPLGLSGYSMLFDRQGGRWVFLCIVSTWIS